MAIASSPQISPSIRAGETVQTLRRLYFTAYGSTPTAYATGVTWGANDVKLSKNGATGASTTNTPTQIDATNNPGEYYVDLTAAEALGGAAGTLKAAITNAAISSVSLLAQVVKTDGTLYSGTATAGAASTITLDSNAPATTRLLDGCDIAITGGTGAGQARKIYYYTSGRVATVFPAFDTTPDSTSTYEVIASAFPPQVVRCGLAQAGSSGGITLDSGASATDGVYFNHAIFIIGGTGAGVSGAELITSYTGSTKVVVLSANWNGVPDSTSVFVILVDTGQLGGQSISSGTFNAGAITASVLASNVLTTAKITSGTLTAACFGTDVTVKASTSGTAQTGSTSTTIKLAAAAPATTDLFKGQVVVTTGGTGANQARIVTAYDGTTKICTVDHAWSPTPDNTTTYTMHPRSEYQIASDQSATAALVLSQTAPTIVAGSVGEQLIEPPYTVGAGTNGATTFSTNLGTPAANAYKNQWVRFFTGTLAGQSQQIASNDASGNLTMSTAFTAAPSNGDRFKLIGQ